MTDNLTPLLACPRCDKALDLKEAGYYCGACKVEFPSITGMPWLFADPGTTLTVDVALDSAAKGALTNLSGFVDNLDGTYTFTGSAAAATAAIQGLTFDPAENRVSPGSTETTTFTITVDDGTVATPPSDVAGTNTLTDLATAIAASAPPATLIDRTPPNPPDICLAATA